MKQDDIGFDVERNGDFKSSKFGIKTASDMVHIFSVLRSKLYSDKVLAVCREYATNACDAHVDAGIPDQPIQVTVPSYTDLFFRVRDFGKGLDEEGIREVYCMYGASTKRNSNAFNGQMGFGSKSAFAYTDFWQINSHCNGTKTCYSIFLDESGLGEVSELSQSPTDETGVEIVIPVDSGDVSDFHNRARMLYRWFRVKPEILGANIELAVPEISIDLGDVKITKSRLDSPMAIMGNVGYPVDISKLLFDHNDSKGNANRLSAVDSEWLRWRCSTLIMSFGIGELQMAASREALEYKDSTVKAILHKLSGVHAKATAKVTTEIMAQTNLRKALAKAQELDFISASGLGLLVNGAKIKWQGQEWDERPCVDDYCFSSVIEVFRSGNRFAARAMDVLGKERISPINNNIVLLDTERGIGVARTKLLSADTRKSVTLLVPAPTKVNEAKAWMEKNLPPDLWVLSSSLPDPVILDFSEDDDRPLVRPRKAPTKIDSAKRAAVYLSPNKGACERSAKSKNWTPAEIDPNNLNLIVQIESFATKGFSEGMQPGEIRADFEALVTAGVLPKNACLFGVRTADLKEATDNGCIMLANVLRDTVNELAAGAELYDAINGNETRKRILVYAKRAGVPMFFDPETNVGLAASQKLKAFGRSKLGRSVGSPEASCIYEIPDQTYNACREMFPLLKVISQYEIQKSPVPENITSYMKLVMANQE